MLRGFATVNYWIDDLEAARRWYAELLGIQPYFQHPGPDGRLAYAEFRIGDYQHELGLVGRRFAPQGTATEPGGVITYWHVDDVAATFERLLSMGAKEYQPITPRGPGVRDRCGGRPVRECAGRHVQPALPGDPAVVGEGVTAGLLALHLSSKTGSCGRPPARFVSSTRCGSDPALAQIL